MNQKKLREQLDQGELEESRKKTLDQKQKQIPKQLETLAEGIQRIEKFNVEAENEYKLWHVSSAVIGSQIKSYFPEFEKKKKGKLTWSAFEETLGRAYGYTNDAYVAVLYSGPREMNWNEVVPNLLKEKDQIIVQIQNASVSGLSEHLFSSFIRKIFRDQRQTNLI